jgi:glycine cleavage system H protein
LVLKDLRYTADHTWVKAEGDRVKVGITDYAQKELGDVVFVDLPDVGEIFSAKNVMVSIESVKAVSEINAPVSGEIMEVNEDLEHSPELVNQDPYKKGWIAIIEYSEKSELKGLMSAADYAALIGE